MIFVSFYFYFSLKHDIKSVGFFPSNLKTFVNVSSKKLHKNVKINSY